MASHPADEQSTTDESVPVPEEVLAWQERIENMTWEEFCQFLNESEDGLAFGGV